MIELTNLHTRPDKYHDTIKLIESEFGYNTQFSFEIDFAPLIQKENYKNLFILLENDEVIGHTGLLIKEIVINNNTFHIGLIGGVVIKNSHQGKGLSKRLLEKATNNTELTFYLLWSDKTDYYKKFDFYPCIQQYQYEQANCENSFQKTDLGPELIPYLKELYSNPHEIRLNREDKDWNNILKITSSDLYLKKENDEIKNYFFINKGQDLQSIIHEYHRPEKEMLNYGYLWTPQLIKNLAPTHQYAALLKINKKDSFQQFIESLTQNKIKMHAIDSHTVDFTFNNNRFQQNIDEFLTGTLGPSRYEELESCLLLYISGLDSI